MLLRLKPWYHPLLHPFLISHVYWVIKVYSESYQFGHSIVTILVQATIISHCQRPLTGLPFYVLPPPHSHFQSLFSI